MTINIEDYLQKIDNNFSRKSQKDIYMTYIIIFSLIFAFSYLLFWDTSEADFTAKRAQVVSLENKIRLDEQFLQQNPPLKITQIKKETKNIQKQMITFKDNNEYIKAKIEEISSLIYDEQTWGKYLHSVSTNAIKHNIKILEFTNTYTDNKNAFGHILDITIVSSGNYKNTINFINSLEQSDLVIDIHTLDIQANNKIDSHLNISVWGITY
ncbi:MAG: type 4a pilus biogenesis protein PilO [Sulfurimonas sp.]|nr:type 4a pilus biogenesis protein PilO [Sulfurimonas sp.]